MTSSDRGPSSAPRRSRPLIRRLPPEVLLFGLAGAAFASVPVIGLVADVPFRTLGSTLRSDFVRDALRVSLVVSVIATVAVVILGTPLAWLMSELTGRTRRVVRAMVLLPMVLPPVVGGTALLSTLGRGGLIGRYLDAWFGVTLPFSVAGAVIAAAFVALPFYVVTVEAAIRQNNETWAEAAATLGSGPRRTFTRITLPMIAPSLSAGAALAWARALGEFGATITFNGSLGGRTQTLPLATYEAIAGGQSGEALTLSLVLLAVSLAVLLSLRDQWFRP